MKVFISKSLFEEVNMMMGDAQIKKASKRKEFKMKKIVAVIISLICVISTSSAVFADTDRGLYANVYSEVGTAYFTDPSKPAYILLSVSTSPDVSVQLLERLDAYCVVSDFVKIPGCEFVDKANKFYKYTNKGMKIDLLYKDAITGEIIWEGTLQDGDTLYLGTDHPNGYRIFMKAHGISYPWAKLIMLDNVTWKSPK